MRRSSSRWRGRSASSFQRDRDQARQRSARSSRDSRCFHSDLVGILCAVSASLSGPERAGRAEQTPARQSPGPAGRRQHARDPARHGGGLSTASDSATRRPDGLESPQRASCRRGSAGASNAHYHESREYGRHSIASLERTGRRSHPGRTGERRRDRQQDGGRRHSAAAAYETTLSLAHRRARSSQIPR